VRNAGLYNLGRLQMPHQTPDGAYERLITGIHNEDTIEQYRELRTRFLATYTGCIAQNRRLNAPAAEDDR